MENAEFHRAPGQNATILGLFVNLDIPIAIQMEPLIETQQMLAMFASEEIARLGQILHPLAHVGKDTVIVTMTHQQVLLKEVRDASVIQAEENLHAAEENVFQHQHVAIQLNAMKLPHAVLEMDV
jgi:hypothetical protein